METIFWGKSGWKLFHVVAHMYPDKPTESDKKYYRFFYEEAKHVLPCIYCRESFGKFLQELPIDDYLNSKKQLTKWIYLMHNKVNNKLRNQGHLKTDDPEYEEIYERYEKYVCDLRQNKCDFKELDGIIFLYCVVFNYPANIKALEKENMPYERIYGYILFFLNLKNIYPTTVGKKNFNKSINSLTNNELVELFTDREKLVKKMYEIEFNISKETNNTCCISFEERCKSIECHRAKCKNNTCSIK